MYLIYGNVCQVAREASIQRVVHTYVIREAELAHNSGHMEKRKRGYHHSWSFEDLISVAKKLLVHTTIRAFIAKS